MHFGADYSSGKYGWTTKKDQIVSGMDWLLKKLNTDYIDFGFIHCIDEPSDLKKYLEGGALEHIQELKKNRALFVTLVFPPTRRPSSIRCWIRAFWMW